jgi:hypothetical protein
MFKALSLARLRQSFPMLADENLVEVRAAIQANKKMAWIDRLLENHGVEYIRDASGAAIAAYSNSGDTYAHTIIRDYATGNYRLTTVGDYVEVYERRHAQLP